AVRAQDKIKISFWFNPPEGSMGPTCVIDNGIKIFNETSKTIQVDAVAQPNTWDATRTALAGGAGPDVVGTPGPGFVFELAKAGQIVPLDDYAAKLGWDKTFLGWAL